MTNLAMSHFGIYEDLIEAQQREIQRLNNWILTEAMRLGEYKEQSQELSAALETSDDENRLLRAKLEAMTLQYAEARKGCDKEAKAATELRNKLEAAELDARRYRWLRDCGAGVRKLGDTEEHGQMLFEELPSEEHLDALIDAAISGDKQ